MGRYVEYTVILLIFQGAEHSNLKGINLAVEKGKLVGVIGAY